MAIWQDLVSDHGFPHGYHIQYDYFKASIWPLTFWQSLPNTSEQDWRKLGNRAQPNLYQRVALHFRLS